MGIQEIRILVNHILSDSEIRGQNDADLIRRLKAEVLKDRQLDDDEMAELERLFTAPELKLQHLRAGIDPVADAVKDLFSNVGDTLQKQQGTAARSLEERLNKVQSFLDRAFGYRDETTSEEKIDGRSWDWDPAQAEARLEALRKQDKLGKVTYKGVPEGAEKLAVQYFLHKIASARRAFNTESDLIIPVSRGKSEPRARYTYQLDAAGNATITRIGDYKTVSAPTSWNGKTEKEAAAELETTYNIVIERGRYKFWSKPELAVLKMALERLGPAERDRLKGTVFVRREEWGSRAGDHETDEKGRTVIAIYDLAFDTDRLHFTGDQGEPDSLRTILHEIGHVMVGNATVRQLERDYEKLRQEQRRVRNEEYVPAYNDWLEKKNDPTAIKRKDEALERNNKLVEQGEAILVKLQDAAESAYKEFIETFRNHPRITDYAEQKSGSWDEFFAEAYSLFKTEPQLLQAEYPELYDYFKAGKYLK